MLTSRERVRLALNHQEADRVPVDLGGTGLTGMHVSTVYRLRQALHLDPPGTPVKVIELFQMLGEIKPDLQALAGADVVNLNGRGTFFGFPLEGWKPWTLFDGTPVLVPGLFNTDPDAEGDILQYPEGDRSVAPSGRMPKDGFYFDAIVRQPPIDEARLDPRDNAEEFVVVPDAVADGWGREAERLYRETDKAICGSFASLGFGDIARVPGCALKDPRGIRDVEEWYVSTVSRRDYVWKVFERQAEVGLANLEKAYRRVGDRVSVVMITGTDFGAQNGPFISPRAYRQLYQPFHKLVNDWVHQHTGWKTFMHCCGSVTALLPDFIEAGFDILNPVQCSAKDMDPRQLKARFGDRITFWGGGVDTQRTLPFGTPDEVRAEVAERLRVFGPGGGFVFATVHNVQARVPVDNLLAMIEAVQEGKRYPLPSAV